jgi:hypothetical protein
MPGSLLTTTAGAEADDAWDRALTRFPDATIFHTSAWARVLQQTYGFTRHFFAQGALSSPDALLPLMAINSPLTGRRGVALPFTDECPLLSTSPEATRATWDAAVDVARNERWRYLELRGPLSGAPASTRFWGHRLSLTGPEGQLFQNCTSAVRRAIRKAQKSELQIEFTSDLAALREFYHLLSLTRRRHGVPTQPWRFFRAIHEHLLKAEQGVLVLARHKGKAIAGALFLHQGPHALYKFGASDEKYQQHRANNLVMWEAINWYRDRGAHELDFGRSSLDNDGLRQFKLSWGTTERSVTYHRYDLRTSTFVEAPDRSSGWHGAIFRRLPPIVGRWAGALLYRHVG